MPTTRNLPPFETICVVGLGYVGLPTAAIFASRGLRVLGVDTDAGVVRLINQGKPHIVEPDLDIMLAGAVASGRLSASESPEPADAFIIAVPTPFKEGNTPDLRFVDAAAAQIAGVLRTGNLVVVESTSPVGTTEHLSEILATARPDLRFPHQAGIDADVQIAHSPERVLPGRVLVEMVRNDRVIGGISPFCAERAGALYGRAVEGRCHPTTARTAELVKLAENAYRDVNIAFANELAGVCERLDIDVWDVVRMANHHPRVKILNPGPGVGGHCIAVDPWFIVDSVPDATPLIRTARGVNDARPALIVRQILEAAQGGGPIACLGLAYKADIDDLRESPAVQIVARLAETEGTEILVVEPHIKELPAGLRRDNVTLCSLDDALQRASVAALLVDHQMFRALDPAGLGVDAVIDTRGTWKNHGAE